MFFLIFKELTINYLYNFIIIIILIKKLNFNTIRN